LNGMVISRGGNITYRVNDFNGLIRVGIDTWDPPPPFLILMNSIKILTTRFDSVKINRVVTMNGQKKFCMKKPALKKEEI
jgi:hypothetical protein